MAEMVLTNAGVNTPATLRMTRSRKIKHQAEGDGENLQRLGSEIIDPPSQHRPSGDVNLVIGVAVFRNEFLNVLEDYAVVDQPLDEGGVNDGGGASCETRKVRTLFDSLTRRFTSASSSGVSGAFSSMIGFEIDAV